MAYLVVYQADDGSVGYEPSTDLDSAITAAERLRNVDGVAMPRIFRTEEVHIDFRPYFRVEVAPGVASATTAPTVAVRSASHSSPSIESAPREHVIESPQADPTPTTTAAAADPDSTPTTTAAPTDIACLLYTSPSPRDATLSRMPSSA